MNEDWKNWLNLMIEDYKDVSKKGVFRLFQRRNLNHKGPIYRSELIKHFGDEHSLELMFIIESLIRDGLIKEELTLGAKNNINNYNQYGNKSYILDKEGVNKFVERYGEDMWEGKI